jgi:hypothetical protein
MTTLIHKRKSKLPTGTVTLGERVIGRVERRTRVAAGTGGRRGHFWTAYPAIQLSDDEPIVEGGASLGTRFATRGLAVWALRQWAQETSEGSLHLDAAARRAKFLASYWRRPNEARRYAYVWALGDSAAKFKAQRFNSHRPRTNIQP